VAEKPKTAEQKDTPLIKASVNYLEAVGYCPKCKSQIERDIAKRIFERIGNNSFVYRTGVETLRKMDESWWQQFWKEFLGEES